MVAQVEPTPSKPRLLRKVPKGNVQVFITTTRSFQIDVMVNALRSASQGQRVLVAQFFQGGIGQGVGKPCRLAENLYWLRSDLSRRIDLSNPNLDDQEKENILALWRFVAHALDYGDYQLVVLEDLPSLIDIGLVTEVEVIHSIEQRADRVSLVVTGTDIPQSLLTMADLVTHKRHPG